MAIRTPRLPLLRGRISRVDSYESPPRGIGRPPALPSRDPRLHRVALVGQLDAIVDQVNKRLPGERDPAASREIIAVHPEPGAELDPGPLGDRRKDVRVVGMDPDTGTVLLDAPAPDLTKLRRDLDDYSDDTKISQKTKDGLVTTFRAHEKAIAPIREVVLASSQERLGARILTTEADPARRLWFELGCRGGYHQPSETENSREQIRRQLVRLGHSGTPQEFVAPEQVYFFVRLSLDGLEALLAATDCVYECERAAPEVRSWLLLEDQPVQEMRAFELTEPPEHAPSIVLLDSGITTEHPLIKGAILSAGSVLPGNASPEDISGHGTKMAGVALYEDVGAIVEAGKATATHWLQSVRLLVEPQKGTASDENRRLWPQMTKEALQAAEEVDAYPRRRAFALAITRPIDPVEDTLWSHSLDQLAYDNGRGRLLCVSAGNARQEAWLRLAKDYPQLHLTEKIHEPAQAANVLTVGAYTAKTKMPPESIYEEAKPVAPPGGISPYTSTGPQGTPWPIKPDVVLEGGNLAIGSGDLTDQNVATLVSMTTGHRLRFNKPLSMIAMTSEATAHAARIAAGIWTAEPSLRPETVRGLIVHSAAWTPTMVEQFKSLDDRLAACGYGVPDPAFAGECARDRATVIVEDEMPNVVFEEEPKKKPPQRSGTKTTEPKAKRKMKIFRMPIREDLGHDEVELRVTLSYFPEPNKFRRTVFHGLDLKWDMQGPQESEAEFLERINDIHRIGADGKRRKTTGKKSFAWTIGVQRRSRGTVQSDRWRGPAAMLADSKLIAVIPVLGWWEQRKGLRRSVMTFSLIVSITGPDIYSAVKAGLAVPVEVLV